MNRGYSIIYDINLYEDVLKKEKDVLLAVVALPAGVITGGYINEIKSNK